MLCTNSLYTFFSLNVRTNLTVGVLTPTVTRACLSCRSHRPKIKSRRRTIEAPHLSSPTSKVAAQYLVIHQTILIQSHTSKFSWGSRFSYILWTPFTSLAPSVSWAKTQNVRQKCSTMEMVGNLEARLNNEEVDPTLSKGDPQNETLVTKSGKKTKETPTIHSVPQKNIVLASSS